MTSRPASRTAEYMAFFRAMESARLPSQRLFYDPFAQYFLRPSLRMALSLSRVPYLRAWVEWYADRRLPGARTSAIARTRLIDEAWCQAMQGGIRQIVILGSGFDCRAYRLLADHLPTVYEMDHPIMLASKLARLRQAIVEIPRNVHLVEIDFNRESLSERLAQAGFDSSLPTLLVWEGVTNYLTLEAVDAVVRYVGTLAPGTRMIFTYVHSGALDRSVDFEGAEILLREVAQVGEPWTFGFSPAQLPDFLAQRGLELDLDAGAREYRARCFGLCSQQMKGYEFYHVAIAHVPERVLPPPAPQKAHPQGRSNAQS
jgi:methyltransferase (TIGR00027 family)